MRTKRACDSCHGRKIHCDAVVPHCNWCKHHGIACTFNRAMRVQKKATTKRTSLENHISDRFDQIEKALKETRERKDMPQGTHTYPSLSSARNPSVFSANARYSNLQSNFGRPSEEPELSGAFIAQPMLLKSIPLLPADEQEWMYSTEAEPPSFQKLLCMGLPWQIQSQDIPLLTLEGSQRSSSLELPDRTLVEECLSAFISSQFGSSFPIIDPVLFQLNIDLAFDIPANGPSQKTDSAKACIFAFSALISLFQDDLGNLSSAPMIRGDSFASAAERMLSSFFQDTSVVTLQIVFMLSFYHIWSGHIEQGLMFHTLSCRVVFILGGHIQPSYYANQPARYKNLETNVLKYIRNIFWLCYELDKEIALRTGQPPVINDDYCDLTLFYNDHNTQIQTLAPNNPLESLALRPSHLQLSIIKSKVSRALYSPSALRKSETELLISIRELDKELEGWRMSFPISCRPPLVFSSQINTLQRPNAKCEFVMEENFLHLEYYNLVEAIHRPSRRCWAWGASQIEKLNIVSSSFELSVQASRSTLFYLRAAIFSLEEFAFWVILFYPVPAVTCIFSNILLKPRHPQAKDDLALLRSVPSLIKDMRKRCSTLNELTNVKMVDEFVGEVIKLGNYAITEASQEKSSELDSVIDSFSL